MPSTGIAKATTRPVNDPFYVSPSQSDLVGKAPGTVLRYRPIPLGSYQSSTKRATNFLDLPEIAAIIK